MSEQKTGLYKALMSAQASFPTIKKTKSVTVPGKTSDSKGFVYKYADLSSIMQVVMPRLRENNIILIQPLCEPLSDTNTLAVRTILHHTESGESLESVACIPITPQMRPQDVGSAITYYRRYALCAILGIVSDADDDGRAYQHAYTEPYTQKKQNFQNSFATAPQKNTATPPQQSFPVQTGTVTPPQQKNQTVAQPTTKNTAPVIHQDDESKKRQKEFFALWSELAGISGWSAEYSEEVRRQTIVGNTGKDSWTLLSAEEQLSLIVKTRNKIHEVEAKKRIEDIPPMPQESGSVSLMEYTDDFGRG